MKRKLLLAMAVLLSVVGVRQANADTSLLAAGNGWTKITTISQSEIANNYYVFVANDADLMLGLADSPTQGNKAAFYQTSADPATDATKVWYLEANGASYSMRNISYTYLQMQTEWSSSSNDLRWRTNDQPQSIEWTGLGLSYADGAWTMTSTKYNRPLGIYNNESGTPTSGKEVGANNSDKGQKFQIYAISRAKYAELLGAGGTKGNPKDITSIIFNPDFNNTAKTKDYGWTVSAKTGGNYNFNGAVEAWHYGNFDMHQTLSVPNGTYKVTLQAASSTSAYLYASTNGTTTKAMVTAKTNGNFDRVKNDMAADPDYALLTVEAVVTNGSLTIGVADPDNASAWLVFDNFKLYYEGASSLEELNTAYTNALNNAKAVDQSAPMVPSDLANLQGAITTYTTVDTSDASALIGAINALIAATDAANASIAAYANAKSYLDAIEDVLPSTNFYTADAYNVNYTTPKNKYDNRTLTTDEANALSFGDHVSGNMPALLLSPWKVGDKTAIENAKPYINTWSTEGNTDGSDFHTPFFEYYVGDGDVLGAMTMTGTITGLTADREYSVSLRGRVRQTNEKTKIANGVTLKVGSGETVDISAGAQFGTTQFYIGNFSAIGTADGEGNLVVTIEVAENSNISWLSFRNVNYADDSALATQFSGMQTEADGLLSNPTYANVIGVERTQLTNAKDASPSGITAYSNAITTLQDAIDNFKAAKTNYDLWANEISKATALGVTTTGYEPTSESTSAAALTNIQTLKVAEFNYVKTNYSYAVELGTWNASSNAGEMSGQHWDGTGSSKYLEQGAGDKAYNLPNWIVTYDQDLSLPAGNYVFKVAGRTAASDVTITLNVKNVTDPDNKILLGTVNDFPKGDTGRGIDVNGNTNYSDPVGDETLYANSNNGRGWEWRYVKFTLAEPATVNVGVLAEATAQYRWMGFCNATVQTDAADNVELMEALVALNDAKAAATLTKVAANIGTGVFQYNETTNDALWTAYTTAKSNADGYTFTSSSTASEVNALATALTTAISNYQNQALNAPGVGTHYKLTLADKGALTFTKTGAADEGGYELPYQTAADYKAQTFFLNNVSGNDYTISFTDLDGNVRYICTGEKAKAGQGNARIRTTSDSEKALKFRVVATATANVFNLLNTENSNSKVGSNGGGMYTANDFSSWTISEATKATVTVAAKAGKYGTVIFPFTPDVSTGFDDITFYSVKTSGDGNVTIETIEGAPKANTPYVIKNSGASNFSKDLEGWGTAAADSYTDEGLIGVYTAATIPASAGTTKNYVLQTQGDVQKFYVVDADFTATAYRAYLTVTTGGVKALNIVVDGDQATGIDAVGEAQSEEYSEIFNAAGVPQSQLQKGLNIVRTADGQVRKVFVK